MVAGKKTILFVAEAVTLAHLARPLALARGLDPALFEIVIACDPRYARFASDFGSAVRWIESISSEQFQEALAHGRPVYDTPTLRRYVDEDVALLGEIQPDLVVGDFRLSLSCSARVARIPYAAVTSAYWSPYARQHFPLAEHPMIQILGVAMAQRVFDFIRPLAFAYHARPLNQVRREHGLASLGSDLRRSYTDADVVLYADPPELVPLTGLPDSHRYLGPVLWSPDAQQPAWWNRVPDASPVVYVTMGSSGRAILLDTVLQALSGVECSVIAATAGQPMPRLPPANAFIAEYLVGEEAARRASLVICNGGSPTSHQALAAGVPVLGIAGNMDQHLNMQGVVRAGAGIVLRTDSASPHSIRHAVRHVLGTPSYMAAAKRLAIAFQAHHAPKAFAMAIEDMLSTSR